MVSLISVKHHGGGVAVLAFEKAESMNSLDPPTMRQVRIAFEQLLADPNVRAIVLTGSGKAFCAGADVKAMQQAAAAEESAIAVAARVGKNNFALSCGKNCLEIPSVSLRCRERVELLFWNNVVRQQPVLCEAAWPA